MTTDAMTDAKAGVERVCGACTYCCHLPEIDAFQKPANVLCSHCVSGQGCTIYAERPTLCRDFLCLWMTDEALGPAWQPLTAHLMLYRQGPQLTVLVDPEHPDAWKSSVHLASLRQWASAAEEAGGYVIVFVGDTVFKIDP